MTVEGFSEQAPAPQRDSAERFDPETMSGGLVEAEHWARYRWAVPWVEGKDVLDAGCGVGYGLRMLAAAGPRRLVGVDLAPEALERARGVQAELAQADLHQLPFDPDSFDLVVCFEVIEHVFEHQQVLDELRRVLRPKGVLLISSPNRDVYAPGNPHHVHEFLPDELRDALNKDFDNVTMFGQHVFLATVIARQEELRSGEASSCEVSVTAPVDPGRETYTIALAGQATPPDLERLIALADGFELRWWHEELAEANARVAVAERGAAEANARLAVAERGAAEANARLAVAERGVTEEQSRLQSRILDLEQEIAGVCELEHELDVANREREVANSENEVNRQVIEDLTSSLSWRLTAPLRALKRLLG